MLSRVFASFLIAFPLLCADHTSWAAVCLTLAFSMIFFLYTNKTISLVYFIFAISLSLMQWGSVLYSGKLSDPYLIISTLATSQEEALSFFDTLSTYQIVLSIMYYLGIVGGLYALFRSKEYRLTSVPILVMALLIFSVYDLKILPINTMKQIYYGVRSLYDEPAGQVVSVQTSHQPLAQTIVLVIGESATKERFSLYGYSKETNQHLGSRSDLLIYTDVLATGINTQPNVKTILTGQVLPAEQKSDYNLISAAQAAGYKVVYIDNNKFAHPNPLYSLAKLADEYININELHANLEEHFSLDEHITDHYRETLSKNEGPLLVVLHMTGSHPAQNIRYPKVMDKFHSDYDSTIGYTDLLLNQWIDILAQARASESALWMYISDHGVKLPPGCGLGEIPPEERTAYGADDRYYSSMAIPLIVWHSSKFLEDQPQHAHTLSNNLHIQLDNRLVLPTILHAMGVQSVNDQDIHQLSLFHTQPEFLPRLTTEGVNLDQAILDQHICSK